MSQRVPKQIIYILFYLAIIGLIIFLIYLWTIKPSPTCFDNRKNQGETGIDCGGPCQSCEIKTLKPLEAQKIHFLQAQSKTVITAEILNSNQNFGADKFTYNIIFFNQEGTEIGNLTNNSFIYPAETKTIFEVDERIKASDIYNASINFSDVNWISEEDFSKPQVQILSEQITTEAPLKIEGVVANQSNFELSSVKIISLVYNRYGIEIGASKTEISGLQAKEQKDFQIIFPPDVSKDQIDQSQTKIFIEAKR